MKRGKYLIVLILLCVSAVIYAQNSVTVHKQQGFRDYCYDSKIKTARIFKQGNENANPIINLRSNDVLVLQFDDLSSDVRRFNYTIKHCDADWNEDNLNQTDYMNGFTENPINDFEYSSNTQVTYTHFWLKLPNEDVSFNVSGNYLVKVYDANTRQLVMQKGFSLVEQAAKIMSNMRVTSLNSQNNKQQLDFKVMHTSLPINDAFIDLKVRVEQNSARISGESNPQPAVTQPGVTDYARPDKNIYNGNNEFRAFDIRNLLFNGQGVSKMHMDKGVYHVLLNDDKIKEGARYSAIKDNNGKYVIGANSVSYPTTQADYVEVFFTLVTNAPFYNGRVFLIGEFTDWNIDDRYEMKYNPIDSQYESTQTLKQGYYNYRYVVLNKDGKVEVEPVEGNFADTENDYSIYVYYRTYSDRYDRLVGYERINTRIINK